MEKIKCYEFDWGDTPLITQNVQDILDHIETEVDNLKESNEPLQYDIKIRMMTQEEIDELPEWS